MASIACHIGVFNIPITNLYTVCTLATTLKRNTQYGFYEGPGDLYAPLTCEFYESAKETELHAGVYSRATKYPSFDVGIDTADLLRRPVRAREKITQSLLGFFFYTFGFLITCNTPPGPTTFSLYDCFLYALFSRFICSRQVRASRISR